MLSGFGWSAFSVLLVFTLAACSGNVTTPTEQVPPTQVATLAPLPTASQTPRPPTATPTAPKPTITSSPTSNPLTPIPPELKGRVGLSFALESEQTLGDYVVRVWYFPTQTVEFIGKAITVMREGRPILQIDKILELDPLTGKDLTGDSFPDIAVTLATGGVSCCFSVVVYNLGPEPTEVLSSPYSKFGGTFQDLDNDGVFEFITPDDPLQSFCGYPTALAVNVIYQYQEGRYRPASPKFANYYTKAIAEDTAWAKNAKPSDGDWDGTTKCSVLPLVLDYLYSGQTDKAWEALRQYYTYPDLEDLKVSIERLVKESPNYVPAEASVP